MHKHERGLARDERGIAVTSSVGMLMMATPYLTHREIYGVTVKWVRYRRGPAHELLNSNAGKKT